MKQSIYLILIILFVIVSCKKEKKFAEPEYIFLKWSRAIEAFNYTDYKACEAYPKSEPVFREIYKETYFTDLMVTEIERLDENKVQKDSKGNSYLSRNVRFECAEVRRRDKKPIGILRGDVDFVKFNDGERAQKGWLMWNRKIIRIER